MHTDGRHIESMIVDLISWLFVVLWMYAAANKILDFQQFRTQIGQSPLIVHYAGMVSVAIPLVEIVLAVMLFIDRTRLIGLYGSFTLMVTFTAYIIAITRFASFVPCSCGGILEHMTWNQHLVFNLVFVFLAVAGVMIESYRYSKYLLQQSRGS